MLPPTLKMSSIFLKTLFFYFLFLKVSSEDNSFTFNGFSGANLSIDGIASITPTGLLQLTNATRYMKGHAFHRSPVQFKPPADKPLSFSTTFVFAITTEKSDISGHGLAFVVSPTTDFSSALSNQYLGLLNLHDNGNSTNRILAIELDTIKNAEFEDIDYSHVGIDINSLISDVAHTAGYYDGNTGLFHNLTLYSGKAMQVWVDYNGIDMKLNVTISPIRMPKPSQPLLSYTVNLSRVIFDSMYVGFSAATGQRLTYHYILGWSFKMNGEAASLDYKKLPLLPHFKSDRILKFSVRWLPSASCSFLLLVVVTIAFVVRRRMNYAERLEDWEPEYGPHRFSYKELFKATEGFKEKMLLGKGDFGRVYHGVLPSSNIEVAVKRVSRESRQGMKEFVAEIATIGHLRHRNVVQLLGYCRRKWELLLVYEFMPNGSLDKFLYGRSKPNLDWAQRFGIIKGVASGLLYLHQDWEQVVVHGDIKASNVLLDSQMNGRLGDFGQARLYDHGNVPHTTHAYVVGTMGYIAPELAKTGKASAAIDVFAFGAFLLEVACGRRPVEPESQGQQLRLVDWVLENWKRGSVLAARDPRLGEDCSVTEIEMVLKLGLLCSHTMPEARPSMRQVMQFLDGETNLREISADYKSFSILSVLQKDGFDEHIMSSSSPVASLSSLSGAR